METATGVKRGNDHGAWSALRRAMESNKDIPIVEVSTFSHEEFSSHFTMGEALATLRDEGILIIGSGMLVHNLHLLQSHQNMPSPQFVKDFDAVAEKVICQLKGEERKKAAGELNNHQAFRESHPTAEHLTPLYVAIGAAGNDQGIRLLKKYESSLSWGSFAFGLPETTTLPQYANVADDEV
ncbi:hypothetical protein EC973_007088 [Apophysomyces ossiformis]|uniref:Extradiol ring-cleavage dioxygenase class III enzyme subunit B domain-containing protein n=1 Tax=Apophysomyces ossiformis TaxID=679940 RepID=A0A8H7BZB3_9FUNG|nr:hypothetical protein EC973_007088 [Apophysomyces ossiformis]